MRKSLDSRRTAFHGDCKRGDRFVSKDELSVRYETSQRLLKVGVPPRCNPRCIELTKMKSFVNLPKRKIN